MPHVFRTVAVFSSADEAFAAKDRLEAAGISVAIDVDAMAGWSWHDPTTVSIVRLSVPADEGDRARELLSRGGPEAETARPPAGAAQGEEDWHCPKCGTEVEPFLDVCWACGTTRDGVEDPEFEPATAPIVDSPEEGPPSPWVAIFLIACPPALAIYLVTKVLFGGGVPEREPEAAPPPARVAVAARDAGPVDVRLRRLEAIRGDAAFSGPGFPGGPDLDALLLRAWRTSVLGVLFFPPLLTLYSIWLVLKCLVLSDGARRRGQWRLYLSLAINLIVLLVVGYMVHLHLAQTPVRTGDAGTSRAGTVCRAAWEEMGTHAA